MKESRIRLILLAGMLISLGIVPPVKAEPALVSILNSLGFTNISQSATEAFAPGTYRVTLFAEFAAYHASNELSWYEVGTSNFTLLFSGPEGNPDYVTPPIVKTFVTNEQFGLSFLSPDSRHFTEISRNTDGVAHAIVFANLENSTMFLLGFENLYGGGDRDYQDMVISLELIRPAGVEAMTHVDPVVLNLMSEGQWITAYIQLPEGCNAEDINATTVLLNGTIAPILDPEYGFVVNSSEYLVDHNNDGISERMVNFNRTAVSEFILSQGIKFGSVLLNLTGQLYDGTLLKGSDAIVVRMPGDVNSDGKVNIFDIVLVAVGYGKPTPDACYYDMNEDRKINILDIVSVAINYGKTYR